MTDLEQDTLVRDWFEEVWNQQSDTAIDQLMTAHCRVSGLGQPPGEGPAAYRRAIGPMVAAFSTVRIEIDETYPANDGAVAYRGRARFEAPDGRCVACAIGGFATVEAGRFTAHHHLWDLFGLLVELGTCPEDAFSTMLTDKSGQRA